MTWHLFLDDERFPANPSADTVICRSAAEARDAVRERGCPVRIDFDHDLGDGEDAMGFLHWFADEVLDGRVSFPEDFSYDVHSQNPIGVRNIRGYLDGLMRAVNQDEQPLGPDQR